MNIWKILDIEETTDKKKIKAAYRAKLREVNPESQPEQFMELRQAYERALKGEEMSKEDEREEKFSDTQDPLVCWRQKLIKLYQDNKRRFQAKEWEPLFSEDICFSLDTRDDAGREFLLFFAEHPYISCEVLKMANRVFHFTERAKELKEDYPEDFVDYLTLYRLKEEEFPRYKYFAQEPLENVDYDEYIESFLKLCAAYDERNFGQAKRILREIDKTGIRHPATEVKRIHLYWEDRKKVKKILEEIEDRWGEYDEAIFARGEVLLEKQPKEAEKCFRRVLEITPDFGGAKEMISFSLREQKKYIEAKNILIESQDSQLLFVLKDYLDELDEEIIKEYENKLRAQTLQDEECYELAIAYFRKQKFKEAKKTIERLKGKKDWEIQYLRVLAFILEEEEGSDQSLPILQSYIEKLEEREKTEKNIQYLAEAYMLLGSVKTERGQRREGLGDIDKAIEFSFNKSEFLFRKATIMMKFEFYESAADVFTQLIEQNPRNTIYRLGRGVCYFYLNDFQDAYDDFEYICMMDENNIDAYIYKMRIYLEVDDRKSIKQLFQFFKEREIDTDSVKLMRGIYAEQCGNSRKAREIFGEIIKNYNPQISDLEHIGEVYLYLAQMDIEENERGITIYKHIDQGLKKEPTYVPLWEKRCEMDEIFEIEEDMESDTMKILHLNPYHEIANAKMVDICMQTGRVDEAREYLKMEQQSNDGITFYIDQIFYEICCGEYESAWDDIMALEKKEGDSYEVYVIKALYYSNIGENEKAIHLYELANEERDEEDGYHYEDIADCYCHMGKFDLARKYYRKMLRGEEKEEAYELLFDFEMERGAYQQAEKMLTRWQSEREVFFKDDDYQLKEGRLLIAKRQYQKAKSVLGQAEVNQSLAKEYMGILNLYESRVKKALKYFLSGMREWPDVIDFYFYAALINLILNNEKQVKKFAQAGIDQLEKDLLVGGVLKDKYKNRGTFLALLGDFEQAKICFEKALKEPICIGCKNCECHEVYARMALAYHLMGEEKKREEMFEKSEKIKSNDIGTICLRKLIEEKKI